MGGGGTDLPSYYQQFGGFLIAGAINSYVYVTIHRTFSPDILLRYSQLERITTAPWLTLVPGIAIVLTVLSLNIFGYGLRDALDPRAKVRIEH